MSNETCDTVALPPLDGDWAETVTRRCDGSLDRARAAIAELTDGTVRDAHETMRVWNEVHIALGNASAFAGLLAQVHPDAAIRDLAEECDQRADALATDLGLDQRAYEALAAVHGAGLDDDGRRVLALALRDFRRAGVDRDGATRERLRELAEREKSVGLRFARTIRDDVRSIRVPPESLEGLPDDYVEDHPADEDGLVTITTDTPDYYPFRMFATDADARHALTVEFLNRAWPANDAVLAELLALRRERATLLGYGSWADYDSETKMIGTGTAIGDFIDRVREMAKPSSDRDVALLLERLRADDPAATSVSTSDATYYTNLVRKERYEVDAQHVRRYLDFDKVRTGMLAVTGRLFGLEYRPVPDAASWHEDVAVHDVYLDGDRIGRIHLDLHPRRGKFQHAAMYPLVTGITGRQLPEGALVCNFPTGLMQHEQVVTLFHEFGHLVHHIVAGRQPWHRLSGVATEWDFVEAPSQMLEEWAWDATVLRTFATDGAGEPIPEELVARMRRAREFGKGYQALTQMFYAALSYRLHGDAVDDLSALSARLQDQIDPFGHLPGTHFHTAFGHLTGYTSAYYTYMWSLAIAKELFSAFDPDDLLDAAPARRYRDTVLARGGAADAADLVTDLLGRPPSLDALRAWLAD